jgi:hypothetical protein
MRVASRATWTSVGGQLRPIHTDPVSVAHAMNRSDIFKLVLALALLGGAFFILVRFLRQSDGISEQTYFYDLSEKKLFAASREALPPIRGINNAEEDAVRAVVISMNGNSKDKAGQKIAYLEKYAPEFKLQIEKVRAGQGEPLPRSARSNYRFVRRVDDSEWYAVSSPEGEKILNEWNIAGSDGKYPVVCVP